MPDTKRDENVIARERSDRSNLKGGIASPEPALSDETRLLRFARNDTSEGARNDKVGIQVKRTILTLALTLTCLLLNSCGGGGGGSSSTSGDKSFVKITLGGSGKPVIDSEQGTGFRENSIPSNIYKLSFTISASDMTT
ncbi:MAG: hypothetical protein HY096_15300, partial [Nitrospinae bacterium]|nr:hypothetical protein [Nitrospinota bacterium]